jgi:hypothetical protein
MLAGKEGKRELAIAKGVKKVERECELGFEIK